MPEPLRTYQGKPCLWIGVPLEQVIAENLGYLFPGMTIAGHNLFRITRDADFPILEDEADDLLLAIEKEINKRRLEGFVCRVEVESTMPEDLKAGLMGELKVGRDRVYEIDGLLNLADLFFFLSLPLPELKDKPWSALVPPRLKPVVDLDGNDAKGYSGAPSQYFRDPARRRHFGAPSLRVVYGIGAGVYYPSGQ
jgi:polyphosphate kinase